MVKKTAIICFNDRGVGFGLIKSCIDVTGALVTCIIFSSDIVICIISPRFTFCIVESQRFRLD